MTTETVARAAWYLGSGTTIERRLECEAVGVAVDGNGAAHHWNSYEFAVAVVSADSDAEKVLLAETTFESLSEWCEYIRDE